MSKESLEVELLMIATLSDVNELRQAVSVVEQEQYDLVSYDYENQRPEGKVRARRVTDENGDSYYLYTKVSRSTGVQDESREVEATSEQFELYKNVRQGKGLWKFRFFLPVKDQSSLPEVLQDKDMCWEVDVFTANPELTLDDLIDSEGIKDLTEVGLDPTIKIELELKADTPEQIEALKSLERLPALGLKVIDLYSAVDKTNSSRLREQFNIWEQMCVDRFNYNPEDETDVEDTTDLDTESEESLEEEEEEEEVSLESFAGLAYRLTRKVK